MRNARMHNTEMVFKPVNLMSACTCFCRCFRASLGCSAAVARFIGRCRLQCCRCCEELNHALCIAGNDYTCSSSACMGLMLPLWVALNTLCLCALAHSVCPCTRADRRKMHAAACRPRMDAHMHFSLMLHLFHVLNRDKATG